MPRFNSLVLEEQRYLKWRALDWLEQVLMILCGVAITGFSVLVMCDVVTRTIGHPWLWLQEVTRRGVLVLSTHNTCAALDETAVEHVLRAYAEAFKYVGSVLTRGDDLRGHLDGPVPTPAFRVRA